MSNSTDKTGCISHRANSRFFIMFEDYLEVAAKVSSKEHRHKLAAFWRVLETKTNDRITYNEERIEHAKKHNLPIPETDLWVEIPYSEFVNRSLEVYKSSSFQIAAAESERLGFCESKNLKRRVNPLDPQSPLEDYKEYLFFSDVMQAALTEGKYPTPIENNSPLLKSLAKRKEERAIKNNTPPIENNSRGIENNSPPLLNSTPPPIENNRNKYSKGYSKYKKDTEGDSCASPDVDAEPSDDFQDAAFYASLPIPVTYMEAELYLKPHGSHEGLDAVQVMKLAQKLWVEAHEDDDPEKTHEHLQAVKKGQTDESSRDNPVDVHLRNNDTRAHSHADNSTLAGERQMAVPPTDTASQAELSTNVDNAQAIGNTSVQQQMLVASGASKQSARRQKKAVEPEPTPEELALKERCSKWYDRLTEWCGGPMTKGGQVINEHRSIKLACQKYSDSQLEAIFTYLTTRDWKYSKIDNKYTVRGYVLWDESGRVAQILKEERHLKVVPPGKVQPMPQIKLPPPMPSREELLREVY